MRADVPRAADRGCALLPLPALCSHTDTLLRALLAAEDSLNISLKDITVTARDGRVSQLEQVYIRGSMVRYFIVPDMLANAPM